MVPKEGSLYHADLCGGCQTAGYEDSEGTFQGIYQKGAEILSQGRMRVALDQKHRGRYEECVAYPHCHE